MSNVWNQVEPPGFTVQRVTYDGSGGDFVRGRPSSRQNALRYKVRSVPVATDDPKISIKSRLTAVATGYGSIELAWGWPDDYRDWTEVAIVRSGFGHPSTVNDGVTLFRAKQSDYEFFSALSTLKILIEDEVQEGRWCYYTLFLYKTEWEPVMYAEALTPRNYNHYEHLWAGIPEYYRWVDGRYRGTEGHLQQFLRLFGFELDLTREMVESWQQVYNVDDSPQPLLQQVGLNLGVTTDQGLGEIRTRSLIGQINQLYEQRGTARGLELVVEAASKYESTVSNGRNMLLLTDDSEFVTGSGNWVLSMMGVPKPVYGSTVNGYGQAFTASVTSGPGVSASASEISAEAVGRSLDATLSTSTPDARATVIAPYNTSDRATDAGYGVMAVIGNRPAPAYYANSDITLACGIGSRIDGVSLTPKYHGVPVEQDILYGFSCRFKGDRLTSAATVGIYWFDRNELFLGTSSSTYPVDGTWQTLLVQGLSFYSNHASITMIPGTGYGAAYTASISGGAMLTGFGEGAGLAFDAAVYVNEYRKFPAENARRTVYSEYAGAAFAVPYISVSNREQGDIFRVMGAMFYEVGPGGTTTAVAPDFYLTMGTGELIGADTGSVVGG